MGALERERTHEGLWVPVQVCGVVKAPVEAQLVRRHATLPTAPDAVE